MRYLLFCFFIFSGLTDLFAVKQEDLKNINEYVLHDHYQFILHNRKASTIKRNYKVIIVNKFAENYTDILLHYNKFRKISFFKAQVKDFSGKVRKKYSSGDLLDHQGDYGSIASDFRVKYLKVVESRYPYILEVSYQIDCKETMFYPQWDPVTTGKKYIKEAVFSISVPRDLKIRYKHINIDKPEINESEKSKVFTWRIEDMAPIPEEPFSRLSLFVPVVYTAPADFEIGGYQGNMESWENYGSWMNTLNEGRNDLTEEDLKEIKEICDNLPTVREKVKTVYKYVQAHTRYISIQLGIGGWQPFPARFVHQKKYGDCKALSFYTYALLEKLGIPAYYTLILAGADMDPVPEDFPSAHFNHAILTVPMEDDTVFLECTSQTNPFGYLGSFTSDRYGLLITPEGGKLIRTRSYSETDNTESTRTVCRMSKAGNALFEHWKKVTGLQLEKKGFKHMLRASSSDQKKWIQDHVGKKGMEIGDYRIISLTGDEVPEAGFTLSGDIKNFCTVSGKRLFFNPFLFTGIEDIRLESEKRVFPIEIRYPFSQLDTIKVILPENSFLETSVNPYHIETKFGTYSLKVVKETNEMTFIRHLELKKGIHPAEEYKDFKVFITKIQQVDRMRYVVVNTGM